MVREEDAKKDRHRLWWAFSGFGFACHSRRSHRWQTCSRRRAKRFCEGFKAASGDSSSSSGQSSETTQPKAQNKSGQSTATVRITGTPGVPFNGNYGSTSAGNRSVDGAIPEDFETSYKSGFGQFDVVTAFFQKQTDDASELTVQIVVDGQVKKEQTTTAAYGVADVSWSTNE
jgi:hypothetical protein